MASENCTVADTEVARAPSPISSQPLVIDCPDNTVMESTSSMESNAMETTSESMSLQQGELLSTHSQEGDTEPTGQSCDILMQTQSSLDLQQCIAGGSTIAQTLQDLVSPGSGIYGTVQAGTMIQSQVAADGSMTIISDGSNQHQQVQFMTPQLHSPMAVLSTIDARQIQQQVIQQQQQRPGSAMAIVSVSSPASRSSQSQQGVCQIAQQPTQQTATVTGFQGLVGQGGTMFGGAGSHMMCSTPESATQSQMDMAMACQQQQQYTIQAAGTQGYQSPMMTGVPQTLQVIQAAGPHQMVQQQCLQQQYMFQTNQVQTLQSVSSGMSLNSPRSSMKNTAVLSIAPQSTGQMLGTRPLVSVSTSKGMVTTASQASGYSAMKPMQQSQQQNGPVVIGQLGVMPNTHIMQQNILPQQPRAFSLCQVNQPINLGQVNQQLNLGQVGQQLQFGQQLNFGQINQPLSFGTLNQALNLGQVNQTLNLGSVNQMLGGQTQIRLATMPNFTFNTGQLVGNGQTVLNFQNVPMMQQQLLATQPTTILGSQPLYIRAAEPYVQQQMSTIAVANVQTPTPIRNIIMSPPMQPAVSSTQPQQQPLRRLQQVQPNNAIAPATTNSKPATTAPSPSTSVTPKPSSKPSKQQSTTPTLAAKSIAPATTTNRPVKPATAVPVTPKSQSLSVLVPACATSSVTTNACPVTVQTANTASVPPSAVLTQSSVVTSVAAASVASSPTVSTKKSQTIANSSVKEKSEISIEELRVRIKVEDEKKVACDTQIVDSAKMPSKPKKPKILTHVIEGFIIQEASEPFPVHGSSLISQLWSPKIPVNTDDGYSSPKSEKDTDGGEDDYHDLNESVEAKKQKLNVVDEIIETQIEGTPIVIAPIPNIPETPVAVPVEQPAPVEPPSLTCEFCGKRDLVQNFARSRRFCSVTCSKRFSAYSMRKAPDGSVTGRPSNASNKPAVRRPTVLSQAQSRPLAVNSPGPDAAGVMTSTATLGPRATDPRVTIIKASSVSSASPSDSWDTEMSSGTGTASQSSGDSSSSSQLSPPALERVERLSCQDSTAATGDDGVLIPSKPLQQWGVQEVYDFIRTLPGCGMYADDFLQQEIDGSALMLLKEDHLMTTMNVKLGPALKICSKISSLKE